MIQDAYANNLSQLITCFFFLNKSALSYYSTYRFTTESDICAKHVHHFCPPYPRARLSWVSAASLRTWSTRAFLFLVSSIRTGLDSGRFWQKEYMDEGWQWKYTTHFTDYFHAMVIVCLMITTKGVISDLCHYKWHFYVNNKSTILLKLISPPTRVNWVHALHD